MVITGKQRQWVFWIGLSLIVLLAGGLRFAAAGFSLPYVDHPDEPNYYLAGLEWRGLFDNRGYYASVPPGYIAIHAMSQPVLESLGVNGLADTTFIMRHMAIIATLFALVFVALSARLLGGDIAGWVAGLSWGLAPIALRNTLLALPDPWVYAFTGAAIWLAIASITLPTKQYLCVPSVVAGLIAVVVKYPAVPALLPGLIAAISLLPKHRRLGFGYLLIQIALIAIVGYWLVEVYGVEFGNLQREGAVIQQQGLSNLLNLGRHANNFLWVFTPLDRVIALVLIALSSFLHMWRIWKSKYAPAWTPMFILLSVILGTSGLASTYALVENSTLRYILPATVAACVMLGIAGAHIATLLPFQQKWIGQVMILALLAVSVFVPHFQKCMALVEELRLPDRRVWLREWFDQNLEPGTVLVDADNHKTFNPIWGGIPHRQWVDWIETDSLMSNTVEQWRQGNGVSYAVVERSAIAGMEQTIDGQAYLSQLLPLRDFFAPPPARGPEMRLYRLWRMQIETDVQFGDSIHLIGYDFEPRTMTVEPGSTLALRLYWNAASTPVDNYSVFIHLAPVMEYSIVAQVDSTPASAERPTLTWADPSETLISPPLDLLLPAAMEAGRYRVIIGLYNYMTGERLPVSSADSSTDNNALQLLTLQVNAG
jgi:GNAT superfamily N-acetyltransferase